MSDPIISISQFGTAKPKGPAFGDLHHIRWSDFSASFGHRREGEKDGPGFVPCSFVLEADGRRVRRIEQNLVARSAIVLDIETSKRTGEIPPKPAEASRRAAMEGWASVVYTSHNHRPDADIRYRIVCPLSEPIDPELPAPEIVAERLGLLGVLDTSKIGGQSLFYYPSSPAGLLGQHETITSAGVPIDALQIEEAAGALLAQREHIAAEAHAKAEARRASRLEAGFNSDDSLIEKLRSRFDLSDVLTAHGYETSGGKFRHPNSTSGSYGADIKVFGGIERLFSHNATDPLHSGNLPKWCGGVTALDAFDVVAILDFGGDRKKALRELASRFGLAKTNERKVVAGLIFRLIRRQSPQQAIEAAALAEGERLGLTRDEVCDVARWVVSQREAA